MNSKQNSEIPLVNIVADSERSLFSLSLMLNKLGWQIRLYRSKDDFLQNANLDHLGCVIAEVDMRSFNPWGLSMALNAKGSDLPVIYIGQNATIETAVHAMKIGASDFLQNPFLEERLIKAVKDVVDKYLKKRAMLAVVQRARAAINTLTKQEQAVLELASQGLSHPKIADQLGLALKTVYCHTLNIHKKLQVSSTTEAARIFLVSQIWQ